MTVKGTASSNVVTFKLSGGATALYIDSLGNLVTGAIKPSSGGTLNFGSTGAYYLNGYVTTLNLNSTASLSGGTAGVVDVETNNSATGLIINNNYSSNGYTTIFGAFMPNLSGGGHSQFKVGQSNGGYNCAEFDFYYSSSGSHSNGFAFGLNGNASIMGYDGYGQVTLANSTQFTASSGMQNGVSIIPGINQSSTAGYTALLVNPTETTTGSGTKLLADFQVGGVSKLSIDNTGKFGGAIQQVLATGASHTVDDVISALQTLGLVRQS
jgi:hypothetical protein